MKTNIPFLLNVLTHPQFEAGVVTTSFIDENPSLLAISQSTWSFASKQQSSMQEVGKVERLMLMEQAVLGPTLSDKQYARLQELSSICNCCVMCDSIAVADGSA